MTRVIRARELIGLPVVSIASGEDIAEVRDVVYDGESHRLVGFSLNRRGFFAARLDKVLTAEATAAVGVDAVMVANDGALVDPGDGPVPLRHLAAARSVIGNTVLTAAGVDLGRVVAVILTTGPVPMAVGYEVDTKDHHDSLFIPISAQLQLSGENLLTPVETEEFFRNDLTGFGAAIESYRTAAAGGSR